MTRRQTDRYVRQGGAIPQIYPGTLQGLQQAMKDSISASKFRPRVTFSLSAVQGRKRTVIQQYRAGTIVAGIYPGASVVTDKQDSS